MRKIRVGIIGLGNMGINHLRVYLNTPFVDVVGLCDINEVNLSNAAKFCKDVVVYTDYKEMLAQESLDAVSIVVPTKLHKEVASAALASKKHILLEKPIAENSEEATEIVMMAKQSGTTCLIGHIERFNPAVVELKRNLEQNMMGAVYSVEATRIGLLPISSADSGVVKELAVHDIDIIRYLFESDVKEISAITKKNICTSSHDLLSCILELNNGIIVHLSVNWVSPIKKRELTVLGEQGMFHLDYINQRLSYYKHSSAVNPYTRDALFKRKEGEVRVLEIEKKEPLALEIAHFIQCILQDEKPFISAEDGLGVLKIAERIEGVAEKSYS